MTLNIFVHEYLSGGGMSAPLDEAQAAAAEELMPMGRAMRDAMVTDLIALPGLQVLTSAIAASPLPHRPDIHAALQAGRLQVISPAPGDTALAFLRRQAARCDAVWVVAPESDGLLLACHDAVCQGLQGEAQWLGCEASAIALTSSKARTLAHLSTLGILTPLGFASQARTQRWVVKPDRGAGCVDTVLYDSASAARAAAAQRQEAGESVSLQPWVEGLALSLTLMCGGHRQATVLSLNQQHIDIDPGTGRARFVEVRPVAQTSPEGPNRLGTPWDALHAWADRIASGIEGLRGLVGIDLVWHATRGPVVIEVNPRPTCAYVGLPRLGGANPAESLLDRLMPAWRQGSGPPILADTATRTRGNRHVIL